MAVVIKCEIEDIAQFSLEFKIEIKMIFIGRREKRLESHTNRASRHQGTRLTFVSFFVAKVVDLARHGDSLLGRHSIG